MRANLEASGLGSDVGSAETLVDRALAAYGGDRMTPALLLPSSLGTTEALWDANVVVLVGDLPAPSHTQPGRRSVEELGLHLLELADAEGLERFFVCGLSLGGATAMWVAANAPERIDRLVLACTSARFGEPKLWLDRAALVREQGLEPIADEIVALVHASRERADVVDRFRRMLVETPREATPPAKRSPQWDFRDRLGDPDADARDRRRAGSGDAAGPCGGARGGDPRRAARGHPRRVAPGERRSAPGVLPAGCRHLAAVEVG